MGRSGAKTVPGATAGPGARRGHRTAIPAQGGGPGQGGAESWAGPRAGQGHGRPGPGPGQGQGQGRARAGQGRPGQDRPRAGPARSRTPRTGRPKTGATRPDGGFTPAPSDIGTATGVNEARIGSLTPLAVPLSLKGRDRRPRQRDPRPERRGPRPRAAPRGRPVQGRRHRVRLLGHRNRAPAAPALAPARRHVTCQRAAVPGQPQASARVGPHTVTSARTPAGAARATTAPGSCSRSTPAAWTSTSSATPQRPTSATRRSRCS